MVRGTQSRALALIPAMTAYSIAVGMAARRAMVATTIRPNQRTRISRVISGPSVAAICRHGYFGARPLRDEGLDRVARAGSGPVVT